MLVGVAQHSVRDGNAEPIDLMTTVAQAALEDSGAAGALRDRITDIRPMKGIWPYKDPGRMLAAELGCGRVRTTLNAIGGNEVYDLVNQTALDIVSGSVGTALIVSAETMRTRRADAAAGRESDYRDEPEGAAPDHAYPGNTLDFDDATWTTGAAQPVNFYAMVESALRHRAGEALDDHLRRITELWSAASEVAAGNPNAWLNEPRRAADLATATAANRMVSAPYPKLLTSNLNVDMGAAVLLCSAEVAEAAGVARDRWVFPLAGASAGDPETGRRLDLDRSPGMAAVGRAAVALAGTSAADVDLVDLYSCFPSAVQVAQHALGLEPDRPFTITGGLTFAGGPFNSYCLHTLARAVELIRDRERTALLTGNGGLFSKHSAVVLGGRPNPTGYRHARPQAEVDAAPVRPKASETPQRATLESYTVTHERDGTPEKAIASLIDDAGGRHWATSTESGVVDALLSADACGRLMQLSESDGALTIEGALST